MEKVHMLFVCLMFSTSVVVSGKFYCYNKSHCRLSIGNAQFFHPFSF